METFKDYLPEEWTKIKEYENIYSISSWGKVRNDITGRILKMPLAGNRYPSVLLYNKNIKPKRFLVHILVSIYYVPNPENKPEVNHKWGNKLDNYFKHLEWNTCKENINHAFDTGLNKKVQINDYKRSKPVIQLNEYGFKVKEYPSLKEVERSNGFAHPNIHHAIKNKIKSYGYYWEYKN